MVSPNQLSTQWLDEARKFFDSDNFNLVEITGSHQFTDPENSTDHTVWLVRNPRIVKFKYTVEQSALHMPCLMADESHLYLRNPKSQRGKLYNILLPKADFVVHMSGTLFPLGPKTDGLRI